MVDRAVYTLRGWLAFVAFIEVAQALRAFRDKDSFLGTYLFPAGSTNFSENLRVQVPESTSHILICYSLQNAAVLVNCALCIHQWSTITMAAVVLLIKTTYLLYESLSARVVPFDFHIIFPVVVYGLTLLFLCYAPVLLLREQSETEENEELLKRCKGVPMDFPSRRKPATLKMKTN